VTNEPNAQTPSPSPHPTADASALQFAFNYRFFIDRAAACGGRILDFGCGVGQTVTFGRARGLDIWGADTFAGYFARWINMVKPEIRDRIRKIENGRADYPADHFDFVMSNQVLEHVTDPEAVVADIHRVVKPGGLFMAPFPVTGTWYEGHVGLYFAHRFKPGGAPRRVYFDLCHRLGFGLYRDGMPRDRWVKMSEKTLDDACFYYPHRRLMSAIERTFGAPFEDIAVDYMRTRLASRARYVPSIANPLLRFVYHKRAGEILRVLKQGRAS
jgi:SAM-dependent methyltransferase